MTTFCTNLISESNYKKLPGQISEGKFRISGGFPPGYVPRVNTAEESYWLCNGEVGSHSKRM